MNTPVIHRGFVFRLHGNAKAEAVVRRWSGCGRKVWNLALAEQNARRERGEKYAGYNAMASWLTTWRNGNDYGYLKEPPVHVLQNVLRALDGAFLLLLHFLQTRAQAGISWWQNSEIRGDALCYLPFGMICL